MEYNINEAIQILERTPDSLEQLLSGLSDNWTTHNEGPDTWSPYDVIGHLIHAEKTDWVVRMNVILADGSDKTFPPFDRFGQFNASKGKTLQQLLNEFKRVRQENIDVLLSKKLTDADLNKTGIHPAFGKVTLKQLLATWVTHDFTHVAQIVRVMAKQYKTEVGPWTEYISILK